MEERLRVAVVDAYTKEGKGNSIEKDLLLLRRNGMASLSQWASLSEEDKKLFPVTLRDILDDASLPQGILLILRFHCFCSDY